MPVSKKPTTTRAAKKAKPSVEAAKPKAPPVTPNKLMQLTKQRSVKSLDRLFIPGATRDIPGYHAGVPEWLIAHGLAVTVYKNWSAKEGDVITVGVLESPGEVRSLAYKTLTKDEAENKSAYYFSLQKTDLRDGTYALVYLVHPRNESGYLISEALLTAIKTTLPAGASSNWPGEGHSEIKFTVSETKVTPANVARGVTVTVKSYPQMHALDKILLKWGGLEIIKPVAGVGQDTEIKVTHAQIIDAGDDLKLLVHLLPVDYVGNTSVPGSATVTVSVDTDETLQDGPAFLTDSPPGFVEMERLNGEPLELECYTPPSIGKQGDFYEIIVRAYPKLGGVVTHRAFKEIQRAGVPVIHPIPYSIVRAGLEGTLEASFALRRVTEPEDIFSRKTSAKVVGFVIYIDAPFFEKYPAHIVDPIPSSLVMVCPWFDWRKPTDELTIVIKHVKPNNEIIMYTDTQIVGSATPSGHPVKRLIYQKDLVQFSGRKADIYFVYRSALIKATAQDINESLRQEVQFG